MTITEPGIVTGIPESVYHGDTDLAPTLGRSLSQSGAKTLLASPARFAWERDHGRPDKTAFDLGSVVHALTLRGGDNRIRVADTTDWKGKVWQDWKREQYAARLIPVHRDDLRVASKIAQSVRRHPLAGAILAEGRPEVSAYAVDPDTGIALRARVDWEHPKVLVDLKTAAYGRGTPDAFGRAAASYDYPIQAWFYPYVWWLITGVWRELITITVETEPPYFVTVGRYSTADLAVGESRMRRAMQIFAERESSGDWTDPPEIVTFDLPPWYARQSA
jgi:hypothetical protein